MTPAPTEDTLSREVEQLRARFSHTQELYREVCALLFFRYGITPTANKLYQLVRKGSMSAPSQALSAFWEELRHKSRTRIEHPDLPEELGSAAGELLATLWTQAQASAQASLAAHRQQADEAVARSRAEVAALQAERDEQHHTIAGLQAELARANQQIDAQREDLAAAHQARAALMTMLERAQLEQRELQQQLEAARQAFSAELDQLRAAAKLTEERTWATEKRLLVDLDRERTGSVKLRKELETVRAESARAADEQRQQRHAIELRLSENQRENARLEALLQAAGAKLAQAESELEALRARAHPAQPDVPQRAGQKRRPRRASKGGNPQAESTLRRRFRLE